MKRAAIEKVRTTRTWKRHLVYHVGADLCVCEFQIGRFRKGQRVGGCSVTRCYLCHRAKLLQEPTRQQRRGSARFAEGLRDLRVCQSV